jgi:hypothetical protein
MRPLTAISFMFAAAVGACSVANPNHCANLEGHATCAARSGLYPYCSRCVADNDGCVAQPQVDACDAGESSAPGTTTTITPTSGDPTGTTTSSTSGTTTTGSSEGQTGTTTAPTTSTDESTGTSTGASTGAESTTDESTDDGTTAPPMCGDGIQELPEICDGADLGQFDSCTAKNNIRYGGGELKCAADCTAYDEAACCLAPGQNCFLNGQACCAGASCQLLGMDLNLFTCKPN